MLFNPYPRMMLKYYVTTITLAAPPQPPAGRGTEDKVTGLKSHKNLLLEFILDF